MYILKVKYCMNRILISENALTKWYLLGSIEFLATLKCLIIICCFLPAEFWQKYAEVSELTGHVRTSGFYGTVERMSGQTTEQCRWNGTDGVTWTLFFGTNSTKKVAFVE